MSWFFGIFCIPCSVSFPCMFRGGVEVYIKNILFKFIEDQTHYGMRGVKMSLHIKTQYRIFFIQTSTLTPSMHQKLTKHGKFCMQNNQLPSNTPVEVTDNSNKQTSSSIDILISQYQLASEQQDY